VLAIFLEYFVEIDGFRLRRGTRNNERVILELVRSMKVVVGQGRARR